MASIPRIVFFGTPDLAVPSLTALSDSGMRPIAVVTRPPEPVGRKATITSSPVQQTAEKLALSVHTPRSIKKPDFLDWFKKLKPDIAVLVAYGKIIPEAVLQVPRLGFINLHPSLLPKHRGAAPIAGAIRAGDKVTGVSLMKLDSEMDHGPVFVQENEPVPHDATRDSLTADLAKKGAALLANSLPRILKGTLIPREQDHAKATYTSLLTRADGDIDWSLSAAEIERTIRAYTSWPGTYTCLKGQRIKIISALIPNTDNKSKPGTITTENGMLLIQTGDGLLQITRVQPEGKKTQTAQEFINGHRTLQGARVEPCKPLPRA